MRLRSIALAVLCLVLTGGVRTNPAATISSGFSIYYISDLHLAGEFSGWTASIPEMQAMLLAQKGGILPMRTALGGGDNGRLRISKLVTEINADPTAAALIVGGDFTWENQDATHSDERYVLSLLRDSLNVECLPVVGNHEVRVLAVTDSASRYNDWAAGWGAFFRPYASQSDQGSTWYTHRVRLGGVPTNVLFMALNNIAADSVDGYRAYWENNGAGGHAPDDYPGILDAASVQRTDLAEVLSRVGANEWAIIAQHRALETGVDTTTALTTEARTPLTAALSAGGYVAQIDSALAGKWIALQADMHETLALSRAQHYIFSSSQALRQKYQPSIVALGDSAKWFAYYDTLQTSTGDGETLLGDDCADCYTLSSPVVTFCTKITFLSASTARAYLLAIRNGAATAIIDSMDVNR